MLPRSLRPPRSFLLPAINCNTSAFRVNYHPGPSLRLPSSSADQSGPDRVIFSGIQPTGIPHIGNYLGALQPWVKLQDEADADTTLIYCIVDLHALTVRQDPRSLRQWKRDTLAILMAVGLDPDRSCIFYQSDVPAHSELMWLLSCTSSMGSLSRMTQWKTKFKQSDSPSSVESALRSQLQLGLFSYPVLQAADILLYRSTDVPIGEDQCQHLEFARGCANTFNHEYGTSFPLPNTILSPTKRVMSLTQPTQKMSKSDQNPASRVLLTDSPLTVQKNIKHALTDSLPGISFEPANRPGIANLLTIMSSLSKIDQSPEDLAVQYSAVGLRAFKEAVSEIINESLHPIRPKFDELTKADDGKLLDAIAAKGAATARQRAAATIEDVRTAVGISST